MTLRRSQSPTGQYSQAATRRGKSKESRNRFSKSSKGGVGSGTLTNSRPQTRQGGGGIYINEKWEEQMHESPYMQDLQSSIKKLSVSRKWY